MATRKIQRAAANKMKRNLRLFMFFRQTKVRKRFMLYVDFRVSYVCRWAVIWPSVCLGLAM